MDVNLEIVGIPVSDGDEALEFYHERLGWRLDADLTSGDTFRAVQLTPTGAGHTAIVIGKGVPQGEPGSQRHLTLATSDIVAAHAELVERGVAVTDIYHGPGSPFFPEAGIPGPDPERVSYNSYASFEDPDGNSWILQEITTREAGREPSNSRAPA